MLDHAIPPEGSQCASCGRPAILRLVALNYPDQDITDGKRFLEAFVKPGDPRPLPRTLDLCEHCWKLLGSLISSNVYHYPTQGVEPWEEWVKPYPPNVNLLQPNGRYRSSHDFVMEEFWYSDLEPDERPLHPYPVQLFKRKPSKKWPPE